MPSLKRNTQHMTKYYILLILVSIFALIMIIISDQQLIKIVQVYYKIILFVSQGFVWLFNILKSIVLFVFWVLNGFDD